MIQTNSYASLVNMLQTQTQYSSEQTTEKSDGTAQFQDLLDQKSQAVGDATSKTAEGKTEKKPVVVQQAEQAEPAEEDPLVAAMAVADLVVAQAVVTLPELQEETVSAGVAQVAAVAVDDAPEQMVQQPQLAEESTVEEPVAEKPVERQPEIQTTEQLEPQKAESFSVSEPVTQAQETDHPESQSGQPEQQPLSDSDESDTTVTVVDAGADVAQPVFQAVEDNMVKVGEAAPTEGSQQTEDVTEQIAQQLTTGLSQGETKVEIQLSPKSLGNVTVEVTAQEDGSLHIALSAENSHTKALLEQHTATLQDLVGTQAQRPVQVEVSQRQEQQQDSLQDDNRNSQNSQQQQQQRQQQNQNSGEDFLQKLRLGLLPLSAELAE